MSDIATTTATTTAAPPANTSPSATGTTAATTTAQTAAPRAGSISDHQYDALDQAGKDRFARVKAGPDGGSIWVDRQQLEAEPKAQTTTDGATTAAGDKVKVGEYELSGDDVAALMQQLADNKLRATQVPAEPSAYEIKLPASLKLPEGIEFKADPRDPAYADMRVWAHKRGLTQEDFSEGLAIYASKVAREEAKIATAAKAEVERRGVNGTQRIDALDAWFRGILGDRLTARVRPMLVTADIVSAMEKIQHRMVSQGAASYRNRRPRAPENGPGRVDEATYNGMSQSEKWAYAKSHDQAQFKSR